MTKFGWNPIKYVEEEAKCDIEEKTNGIEKHSHNFCLVTSQYQHLLEPVYVSAVNEVNPQYLLL